MGLMRFKIYSRDGKHIEEFEWEKEVPSSPKDENLVCFFIN